MDQHRIDERVFELYDEYCHGVIDRREFFRRAATIGVGATAALTMAQAMLPRYAEAETVSFNDPRITARYVEYPSPGGNSGRMRGYLVQPKASSGPFASVLVVHENRGLNPYVRDVARRAAVAGYLALAPDALAPLGGYPGNDDDGREMQRQLDQEKLRVDMLNSARFVKFHELSSGRLGVTGFCWGGGICNHLATVMGSDLHAAVPYYGAAAPTGDVPRIEAPLQIHAAEYDPRINAMWPEFKAALDAYGKDYEYHVYPGTRHGFHNDSTPRYDAAAAELAWRRTLEFFAEQLA
jgi:carboxymethylenebutenolidase